MSVRAQIVTGPIVRERILAEVASPACGAEVSFFGVVRAENAGRPVSGITYDVFEPLAAKLMSEIASGEADRIGGGSRIALVHRVGLVRAGEISVAIAVAHRHRDEAFTACRNIIEAVKHRIPIWKLEHYENGDSRWLEGCSLCRER